MALGSDLPEDKTPPLPANLHCCALEVNLIAFLTRGTFWVSAAAPPNTWGQKNSTCFTIKVLRSQKQAVGEGQPGVRQYTGSVNTLLFVWPKAFHTGTTAVGTCAKPG